MIRKRLQNRRVVAGIVIAMIALTLVLFLWQNRDTAPTSDRPSEAKVRGSEVAAAPKDTSDQPEGSSNTVINTSTASPTASVTASATATPRPSPTSSATATPTPTQTPRPTRTPRPTDTPRPTRTSRPTPTPQAVAAPTHTPTPSPLDCLDATYLADVTIPDNTRLERGEGFVKTWRVRNNGACPWPEDTRLVFVRGDQMGAPDSVTIRRRLRLRPGDALAAVLSWEGT
jgi:hypothetical protein